MDNSNDLCFINEKAFSLSEIEKMGYDSFNISCHIYPRKNLFKYYSNKREYNIEDKKYRNYSIEALKNNTIYLQDAKNFDDCFDCAVDLEWDKFLFERVRAYCEYFKVDVKSDNINEIVYALSLRLYELGTIEKCINKAKKLKEKGEIKLQTKNDLANIESDIQNVVNVLNSISKGCPIVFVVDELDRCLPNNAIKTLERLHHILGKVNNAVTVISVCRKQLNESIKQMFGDKIDANEYLKKFIDFNLDLDNGLADVDEVEILLEEYSSLFDKPNKKTVGQDILIDICDALLPREYETICRNALLCHKLTNEETTMFPYECMVAEIIAQAYLLACKKEGNSGNVSPDWGNEAKTQIGKTLKEYFKRLRNITFFKEPDGLGIIAYILKNILNFKYDITSIDEEMKEGLVKKLDSYYQKYYNYFTMIK